MIKSLTIDNIALIKHLELNFESGLTVLSGETGSGKSIIIDSLSFVLGERADRTLIKYGEEFAEVSALFEADDNCRVLDKLDEYGYLRDNEILISRRMSLSGKNEIRVQGKACTLAILKEICGDLVDIFGQGQHLALLNEKNQLAAVDAFCEFGGIDTALGCTLYPQLAEINKQLRSFGGSEAERERLADILKYQISEIEDASLCEDEENELLIARKRMMNIEKIASALAQAVDLLNSEQGAVSLASRAAEALNGIAAVEPKAEELGMRLNSAVIELGDIGSCLDDMLSLTEFSPSDVDRVEERLEKIRQIKRKYGGSIPSALEFLQDARVRYDNLVNSSERIEALNAEKNKVLTQMYSLAKQKSEIRRRTAENLSASVMRELDDLGMKGTDFEVTFNDIPSFEEYCASPSGDGFDKAEFLMSANVGEPLKPLSKVISGGEMSRFMLAVKNITAQAEHIPTMVFDEIDTGISGNMARRVAEKLANVSAGGENSYQCIVITHLPQIVAMADCNLYIEKYERDGKTHTEVSVLDNTEQKAKEVARLMGSVGEYAIANAKELIDSSQRYKKRA